jgi:RNA polymerase-binding transcription factor DksA
MRKFGVEMEKFEETLAKFWGQLMLGRHFQEAATVALIAKRIAEKQGNVDLGRSADSILERAVSEITEQTKQASVDDQIKQNKRCSFCGREIPEVKLAAGLNVFICNECVSNLHDVFSRTDV